PSGGRHSFALGLGCEAELLTRHGGLVHGTTLDDGEYRDALVVLAGGLGILHTAARTSVGTFGTGAGAGGPGNCQRIDVGSELEVALGEFIEGALILEEDDLAVGLAASLQADTQLRHRGVPDVGAVLIDMAVAVRATHDEAALADRGKHRVTVAVLKVRRALPGILEQSDGIGVLVRIADGGPGQHDRCQQETETASHESISSQVPKCVWGVCGRGFFYCRTADRAGRLAATARSGH